MRLMICKIQVMEMILVPINNEAQAITALKRRYDYFTQERKTIIVKQFIRERPYGDGVDYKEIEANWFDYDSEQKWLLVRLHSSEKYVRILFKNVHDCSIKKYGGD